MNGAIIKTIIPNSRKIVPFNMTFDVPTRPNKTSYNFSLEGAGTLDGLGLGIDNVKFYQQGTTNNLIQNGDFESPKFNNSWRWFYSADIAKVKWITTP